MIRISKAQLLMIASTVLFASLGLIVKSLKDYPVHQIVFFRAVGMLVICIPVLVITKTNPLGNNRRDLVLRALFGTTALFIYFFSLTHLPLATAVTITYLSPIFTILIAGFFMKEKASKRQWIAFAGAFIGVLLIKGFDPRVKLAFILIAILGAVCSGFAHNFVRRLRTTDSPLVVTFYFPLITLLTMTPLVVMDWVPPRKEDWLWLGSIGLVTYVAQLCMTNAYFKEKAANVTNFNAVGVIYAIAMGYLLFGEAIPWLASVGIGVILLSIAYGQGAFKRSRRARKADELQA